MRFGSVCSGIEAASVAFHPLGWKAAWLAEIEPFPCAVLAHHYPDVPNLGDMTAIAQAVRAGTVEAPDLLCGGTPCQAFSVAGQRQSLDDARGNLTLTFVEIADAIDDVRTAAGDEPGIVLWENVPGVLSTSDNAFGCFLGALSGAGCELQPAGGRWTNAGVVLGPKRAVAWRVLDAQFFGLAQRRRRVFVVASARAGFDPAAVLLEFEGVRRDFAPSREAGEGIAGGAGPGVAFGGNNTRGPIDVATARNACGSGSGRLDFESETFLVQPTCSTLDASFGRLQGASGQDMNHGHSHLVPQAVALRGRDGGATAEMGDDVAFTLRASEGGGDKPHVLAPVAFDTTQITSAANRSNPKPGDPCHPLAAGAHAPAIAFSCKDHGADAGPVSPTLRSMGHDGSHANGGGQVAVAFAIQAGALRTNPNSGPDGVGVQADHAYTIEARAEVQAVAGVGMQVRRLTPVECEKLQGFPPNYTRIPYRNKPAEKCPDGPRYKALGNSWAVPCVAWIGQRIQDQL